MSPERIHSGLGAWRSSLGAQNNNEATRQKGSEDSPTDALGRPLALRSVAASVQHPTTETPVPPPVSAASTRVSKQGDARVDRTLEIECLALVRDHSAVTPAEPTALQACKAVLQRMTEALVGGAGSSTRTVPGDSLEVAPARTDLHQGREAHTTALVASHGSSRSPSQGSSSLGSSSLGSSSLGSAAVPSSQNVMSSGVGGARAGPSLSDLTSGAMLLPSGSRALPSPLAASLRNEAHRCALMPNHEAPPVLMWRAKRVGGATVASILVWPCLLSSSPLTQTSPALLAQQRQTPTPTSPAFRPFRFAMPSCTSSTWRGRRGAWAPRRARPPFGAPPSATPSSTRRSATGRSCAGRTSKARHGAGSATSSAAETSNRFFFSKPRCSFCGPLYKAPSNLTLIVLLGLSLFISPLRCCSCAIPSPEAWPSTTGSGEGPRRCGGSSV